MLDMTTKAVADTGLLELNDVDDEPLFDRPARTDDELKEAKRCSITLYSPGTRVYQEAEAERQNRLSELVMKKSGKFKISAEERRQLDAVFHARVTASFNHWTYPVGDGVSGFEMFKTAYLDARIGFIEDQVRKYIGDWGNFKKSSPAS